LHDRGEHQIPDQRAVLRAQAIGTPAAVEACRYSDTQMPEPGEFVPQQIHVTPAGVRLKSKL